MIKTNNNLETESVNTLKKILIGTGISIIITLIGLVIYAIFLKNTSIAESTIPAVTIIITVVSILIGSSLSMINVKKNGIINGALIGAIYILIIYILSSIIEGDFSLNIKSLIMIIGSILAGALGGIIGVNKH